VKKDDVINKDVFLPVSGMLLFNRNQYSLHIRK